MTKRHVKREPALRSAKDVLNNEQLLNSRVAKINGSNILFLVSPQILQDKFATRHLTFLTHVGKENTLSEGSLRSKYWSLNFFDPSDWFAKFKSMDKYLQAFEARMIA